MDEIHKVETGENEFKFEFNEVLEHLVLLLLVKNEIKKVFQSKTNYPISGDSNSEPSFMDPSPIKQAKTEYKGLLKEAENQNEVASV